MKADTKYIYRWRKQKKRAGWKHIALILPAEVATPVIDYKRYLMTLYKEKYL